MRPLSRGELKKAFLGLKKKPEPVRFLPLGRGGRGFFASG